MNQLLYPLSSNCFTTHINIYIYIYIYILEYLRLVEPVIAIYAECFDGFQFGILMICRPSGMYNSNSFTWPTLVGQWFDYFSGPFTVT